jgi:hypothetical protein
MARPLVTLPECRKTGKLDRTDADDAVDVLTREPCEGLL